MASNGLDATMEATVPIMHIRPPAVAGLFYPADEDALRMQVQDLLAAAREDETGTPPGTAIRAMILPHAGYPYSGAAAARGYALLRDARHRIRRVILLGPSHFVPFHGLALPEADALATPLGAVPVDPALRTAALELPPVFINDAAHEREHSLEVHLPFLQTALDTFSLLPLAVGRTTPAECGRVIEHLWDTAGEAQTLVVVSSDLSHFHDDATARRLDGETTRRIESLDLDAIDHQRACGADPVKGLLWVARRRGWAPRTVALCNSSDTTGDRTRVVGYGSYVFH